MSAREPGQPVAGRAIRRVYLRIGLFAPIFIGITCLAVAIYMGVHSVTLVNTAPRSGWVVMTIGAFVTLAMSFLGPFLVLATGWVVIELDARGENVDVTMRALTLPPTRHRIRVEDVRAVDVKSTPTGRGTRHDVSIRHEGGTIRLGFSYDFESSAQRVAKELKALLRC